MFRDFRLKSCVAEHRREPQVHGQEVLRGQANGILGADDVRRLLRRELHLEHAAHRPKQRRLPLRVSVLRKPLDEEHQLRIASVIDGRSSRHRTTLDNLDDIQEALALNDLGFACDGTKLRLLNGS